MKVAAVQFSPVFADKEQNISKMAGLIEKIDSEIIVFPELAVSGYFFISKEELKAVAEPSNGKTISIFQEFAIKTNKTIIFGFPECFEDKFYNSAAILLPDDKLSRIYRKTHLFYKEKLIFEPGNSGFFVIDNKIKDLKIGTMICYDWRFPESARTLGLLGADLIVCPSNLVTNVWHISMPSRALENKVYLIVANRIGMEARNEEELVFTGETAIWGYNGKVMTKAGWEEESILIAEIHPELTRNKSFNAYNNIDSDRRPEMYYDLK